MMSRILKREVFIPIEIKPREFVSQLLLSGELAKIGLRVYIGSKKSVDNLVQNKVSRTGIYLYKGGGGSIDKFKNISKKVESIAVLDQEISPASIDYRVIRNRFVKGCLKYVSRLYYIGPEAKKKAIEVLDDVDESRIKSFGWPRVDLWQPAYHHIWDNEVKKIKSKFPEPFILFSSDFGCNSKYLLEERILRMEKRGAKKTKEEILWYKKRFLNNYENFIAFKNFLRQIDKDPEIPKIIIRPHPGEDHSEWEEFGKNLKNINIIYEGAISPWILASEGILHRGCTSAIEAAFSRKKIGFLSKFSENNNKSVSNIISSKITDLDSLKNWFITTNELPIEDKNINHLLSKHITFSKNRAVNEIAKDMAGISGIKIKPSHIYKHTEKKINIKNFFKKVFNKIYQRPNYIPKFYKKNKMQNGIKLSECQEFLSLMYPKTKYKIENPTSDLIKIEI